MRSSFVYLISIQVATLSILVRFCRDARDRSNKPSNSQVPISVQIMPIIASAMQHSYDGDPIVAHGVENQMVADWKKAQAAGEVVAVPNQAVMA